MERLKNQRFFTHEFIHALCEICADITDVLGANAQVAEGARILI